MRHREKAASAEHDVAGVGSAIVTTIPSSFTASSARSPSATTTTRPRALRSSDAIAAIRRFGSVAHRWRWAYTLIGVGLMASLVVLVADELVG